MRNQFVLSRLLALILFLSAGFATLNAQNLPYEIVTRDGQSFYIYNVQQGEGLHAISRTFSVSVAEILRHNPGANTGLQLGQRLYIPAQGVVSDPNATYHVILPQETLFSVSRAFSLRPDDLIAANPGLSAETFQIGRMIRIPLVEVTENVLPGHTRHVVQAGETLFSISRQYQVEIDDITRANPMVSEGLRTDMKLQIPIGTLLASTQQVLSPNLNSPTNTIRVGLLLPFNDETGGGHHRMQEYYEGFMLAVERLKGAGANMEIFPFDIGRGNDTRRLESILGTLEWQSLDLIIGGTDDTHIRILSNFARTYNIKHVIPFRQNVAEVQNNQQVFQVNPPPNILHIKASNEFLRLSGSANIVFVTGGNNNQTDFVNQLQSDLRRNNISFETVVSTNGLNTALIPLLSTTGETVIVPTSDEQAFVRLIMNELEEVHDANSNRITRLFGYPNWQTYSALTRRFHQFGTYIFTSFYVDNNNPETRTFNDNFRRWYGRPPMPNHPSFAMWGYDTGLFFLTALHRHGVNFEQHIHQVRVPTLQHTFSFERANNWGGFINTGMYIVHFDTNGTIHKIDRSR
ncbi:MAG: LysM peptidoglycan-binding domain-containing protein [Dysgonamonadaceae bacterium]|jgi:LysM repeat protein|nr:LysM peptidoglycan-binding domain-containing protein [Dysgonamonadaceae bacterium]